MIDQIYSYLFVNLAKAQESLPPVLAIPTGTGVTETGTVGTFVASVVTWVLGFIGIILFSIILISGFKYATAGGDPKKAEEALGSIQNAIIGLLIIGGSWVLANAVLGFVFNPAPPA